MKTPSVKVKVFGIALPKAGGVVVVVCEGLPIGTLEVVSMLIVKLI
jgi:hypothetical protein